MCISPHNKDSLDEIVIYVFFIELNKLCASGVTPIPILLTLRAFSATVCLTLCVSCKQKFEESGEKNDSLSPVIVVEWRTNQPELILGSSHFSLHVM